ncbi:hypothetical protein D8M04_09365 [Oceanobacillus piezotolerans]|uniref:Membrane protein YizD n=1 Tax=Oceanobacillus piezotolerans TaxID=2448030 RepID=A0A498D5T1_9BACI|nr:hypothetical protein [Oceanobacillus piezotolerans]RLL45068.1 hypothetical protein D8M04_09365 [Oceanobacillus piezotolerans]
MQQLIPFLFFILLIISFFLNILGLLQLIPLYLTLPLLFISIYLTIYSFANQNTNRRRIR